MEEIKKLDTGFESSKSESTESSLLASSGNGNDNGNDKEPKYSKETPCYYNCLAYIASKYGWKCSPYDFADDYSWGTMKSDWSGTWNKDDKLIGPNASGYDENGNSIPNPEAYSYIENYFDTEGSGWVRGKAIGSLMTSEQQGIVMGVITTPGSNMHAVILKERAYGVYSYYDPTTGVSGQLLAGSIAYAGKVTGLKKKEESE